MSEYKLKNNFSKLIKELRKSGYHIKSYNLWPSAHLVFEIKNYKSYIGSIGRIDLMDNKKDIITELTLFGYHNQEKEEGKILKIAKKYLRE